MLLSRRCRGMLLSRLPESLVPQTLVAPLLALLRACLPAAKCKAKCKAKPACARASAFLPGLYAWSLCVSPMRVLYACPPMCVPYVPRALLFSRISSQGDLDTSPEALSLSLSLSLSLACSLSLSYVISLSLFVCCFSLAPSALFSPLSSLAPSAHLSPLSSLAPMSILRIVNL